MKEPDKRTKSGVILFTNRSGCRSTFSGRTISSSLGKAKILSERKCFFFRRKMKFSSNKTKFSFGQKTGHLSAFSNTLQCNWKFIAVEEKIHCYGIRKRPIKPAAGSTEGRQARGKTGIRCEPSVPVSGSGLSPPTGAAPSSH